MPDKPQLNLMVASTIYHFEDQIRQICAVLTGYGYTVWNSYIGTIPQHPGSSNLENCLTAVRSCDLFFGIIRPFYGSSKVHKRSITHEEFREAMAHPKPRWSMVHRDVTFARQLLRPYMFKRDGTRTKFTLKKNSVFDDLRIIDLYNDATQNDIPVDERQGHWVQEFYQITDVFIYLEKQFKDENRIRLICEEMRDL